MRPSLNLVICLFLLFSCISGSMQGQQALLQNVGARNTTTLDGLWDIIVDPLENGYYNHRYQPKQDGFFIDRQMENKSELIEYDFASDYQLYVPGDWNTQIDKLFYYEGTVWYRRKFPYAGKADQRTFLYFGAVNYDAKVYLNGELVGEHIGGFTAFNFDVTGKLNQGENTLVVKVDNKRKRENIPTVNIDWWNYGGITRSVYLVETPRTLVQDYSVQLKKGSTQEIEAWVQLGGDVANQRVSIEIPEAKIKIVANVDANGKATFNLRTKVTLWTPENPKLYATTIKAGDDVIRDQIGFRTIETRGFDILLNGKSTFLRGICIHEEAPFRGGRVTTPEESRVLLSWAKELGCNFVRLAHYPHSEAMVKEAEKMGLMVWSEIPVYWTILFNDPDVYANAKNQLHEMIRRDKNRANVILWSVANETPVSDARVKFLSDLITEARTLDPTRLVTAALDTQSGQSGAKVIDDPLGEFIDVIGINNYCGWYAGAPKSCGDIRWENKYNKPMVMSEVGGGALQGNYGEKDERWTEEYLVDVYENNIEMMKKIPFLRGITPWLLTDFYSPRRNLRRVQDDHNRKGLISNRGIKKKAFFTLQEYYESVRQTFK